MERAETKPPTSRRPDRDARMSAEIDSNLPPTSGTAAEPNDPASDVPRAATGTTPAPVAHEIARDFDPGPSPVKPTETRPDDLADSAAPTTATDIPAVQETAPEADHRLGALGDPERVGLWQAIKRALRDMFS
jgi:hypothetical protein